MGASGGVDEAEDDPVESVERLLRRLALAERLGLRDDVGAHLLPHRERLAPQLELQVGDDTIALSALLVEVLQRSSFVGLGPRLERGVRAGCENTGMGLCECSCGEDAGVYATTAKGHRKGEPKRFVNGHNGRVGGRPFTPLDRRYVVEDRGYETACWIWTMTLTPKGYGRMWSPERGRLVSAHRHFYEHFVGPIPDDLQIDHLCRQRACVNPTHLEVVTQFVNQQRGANAKLTREQANEIHRRGSVGDRGVYADLAREYGVSRPVISGIVKGTLWP